MPPIVSHNPEIALAEMVPDGRTPAPELDPDLDVQDVDLHEPPSELEIAVPGRW